jgi:N-acetylglutamate synthase-like GNAT family acetyltransferase
MTELRAAQPADMPAVEALLLAAGLPLDGAEDAFAHGVVAEDDGRIVAAAATERFPGAALLRSVAVREDRRGQGAGRALVQRIERDASEAGVPALYLLTETAAAWFEGLGYDRIEREAVPDAVRRSVEFTTACAETAIAMVKRISASERR